MVSRQERARADEIRRSRELSREPLYLRFARVIRTSVETGRLAKGVVLLEGPLAEILGSSRAPVRRALAELSEARLLSRLPTRGYAVGGRITQLKRIGLSPDMFDIAAAPAGLRKAFGWEVIYEEVERAIIQRSVFGRFRINELELARHFDVGRTVARDVLTHLSSLGLIEKDPRSRWMIVPLGRERLLHLYEVREYLEPAALLQAMPYHDPAVLHAMRERLVTQLGLYPRVSAVMMNDLEYDLHVRCLAPCPNREILGALGRTRCTLTLSKHVLGIELDLPEKDPFLEEHLRVIEALIERQPWKAVEALKQHLRASCPKVVARMEAFRNIFRPADVAYLS